MPLRIFLSIWLKCYANIGMCPICFNLVSMILWLIVDFSMVILNSVALNYSVFKGM